MLTSYHPSLDATFCNPVIFVNCPISSPPLVDTSHHQGPSSPCRLNHQHCLQEPLTTRGCSSAPVVAADHLTAGQFFWWPDGHLHQRESRSHCKGGEERGEQSEEEGMEVVQPEEDLKRLVENDLKLRLSGFYYGCLGWVEASEMLKKCDVGTFLVRDSEHASYLYSLSVQTTRGPTSCRVDYNRGRFRLDSSDALADQMPRFDTATDLIEHYVRLTRRNHKKPQPLSPVWLDLAGNDPKQDVPVQMCKPLYRGVRSLQHLCRVRVVRVAREARPQAPLDRTIGGLELPKVLKDYLREYSYSQ